MASEAADNNYEVDLEYLDKVIKKYNFSQFAEFIKPIIALRT